MKKEKKETIETREEKAAVERLAALLEGAPLLSALPNVELARILLRHGVLMPPVQIGQKVYAAIEEIEGYEDYVTEDEVYGVAYVDGTWLVCGKDREWNEIGAAFCRLTREEAEEDLVAIRHVEAQREA